VKEILAAEEPAQKAEVKPMREPAIRLKPKVPTARGIILTENALRVLERRYLKKDKRGKVIETPEEMFCRVAQAIASAELIYNPRADVKAREARTLSLPQSIYKKVVDRYALVEAAVNAAKKQV
jgi:ribonucleoside-diphosphate reductase alpha chain